MCNYLNNHPLKIVLDVNQALFNVSTQLLFSLPHSTGKLNFWVCSPSQPWLYKKKKRLFLLSGPFFQAFDKTFERSYLKSVLTQKIIIKHLYPSRLCPVFRLWEHSHVKVAFRELLLARPLGIEGKTGLRAWSKRPKKCAANGHQPAEGKMKEGRKIQLLMWWRLC